MKIDKLKVLLKVGLRKLSHKNNDSQAKSLKKIGHLQNSIFKFLRKYYCERISFGNCEFKLQYW